MKNSILILLLITPLALLFGQTGQTVDSAFTFQTNNAKKYSLYIPSSYEENKPQKLMLGLHPLNTSRWDAQAWRDTLIKFAETNDLLLVCPDGGVNGKVDDAIDTAFTSVLLDSVSHWYNINETEKYIMGFSWGGKTTYTYGLRRTEEFKGFLVIGAAVSFGEVSSIIGNAKDQNFYLVHGSNDNVNTRFTPLLNALEANGACTNSNLLSGVGHTIDFPNRNAIFTTAFETLENSNCNPSATVGPNTGAQPILYPNPFRYTLNATHIDLANAKISIYDRLGQKVNFKISGHQIQLTENIERMLYVRLTHNGEETIFKVIQTLRQ